MPLLPEIPDPEGPVTLDAAYFARKRQWLRDMEAAYDAATATVDASRRTVSSFIAAGVGDDECADDTVEAAASVGVARAKVRAGRAHLASLTTMLDNLERRAFGQRMGDADA
jgi:hypothetical protein